jgi:UDP-N-acetylmuramoyl-tripeptide--D-alanyl-D-alanine ligase
MASPRTLAELRKVALDAGLGAAAFHRRRLKHVSFIGVTGSCGKTTTKELIAAVLGASLAGRKSPGGDNSLTAVGKTVLRTTASDAFCVVEIAAWQPGSVARAARVVAPDIAVLTNIGADHRQAFRTLEAIAAEKQQLLDAVVTGGIAVLNADDERVSAMAEGFRGDVITYGCSSEAALRAERVSSRWPERLSFTLRAGDRSHAVRTRLCGEHFVTSALAALGVAAAMHIPLERAVDTLATVEPVPARMSPVVLNGVTFIRDDAKAPLWTMDGAFAFLAQARVARKLAVIGTISDFFGSNSRAYRHAAEAALTVADEVLFVGPNSRRALNARGERLPLHAFETVDEAVVHLRANLREGDLVVVKGSRADRLQRILQAATG